MIALLRDMVFLTPARARLYGGGLALALAAIFANLIRLLWRGGGYDSAGDLLGGDFASFWAASAQALSGRPADAYVARLHFAAEQPYLKDNYEFFFYPPTYLLVCLPLALLPFFVSYTVFMGASFAAFVATVRGIVGSPWALAAVLAFSPVYLNVISGQNAFLVATILGCGLSLMDRRPVLAGAILGLMVVKPHLALGVPFALLAGGRWRTLFSAAAAALLLVALSYALLGRETWTGFLDVTHDARAALEHGHVELSKMQSVYAVMRLAGAGVAAAYAAQAVVALGAIAGLFWALRRPLPAGLECALTVLACLLITPFVLFYDATILMLPLAWMFVEWRRHGFPPWSKFALCVAVLAPLPYLLHIIYDLPFLQPFPFAPPALLLLAAVLLREVAARRRIEAVAGG